MEREASLPWSQESATSPILSQMNQIHTPYNANFNSPANI
jgi:hypothetical protein